MILCAIDALTFFSIFI